MYPKLGRRFLLLLPWGDMAPRRRYRDGSVGGGSRPDEIPAKY
jgi:hypothetical protein